MAAVMLAGGPIPAVADSKNRRHVEDVSDAEKIQWAKATRVPVKQAIETATARTSGQVIEAALESIDGRLLYEIEIVTKDGKVVEVFVDPQTGRLADMGDAK
jgi:uncharacterized membrane protein YkoI